MALIFVILSSFAGRATAFESLFDTRVDYAVGDMPISVFTSDLNDDSYNYLVVTNYNSNNISVLLNNGDGSFHTAVTYWVGQGPSSVFAADLDGNLDNDLAVACDSILVFLNNGDGTFQEAVNYRVGQNPSTVFAADLDGDSDNDLAVADFAGDSVFVLINNGNRTFQTAVNCGAVYNPRSIFVADLDGDSFSDLAVTNDVGQDISILLNLSNQTRIEVIPEKPSEFGFLLNRPNPFNASTSISFLLSGPSEVRLIVYDLLGRRVAVLLEGQQVAGEHAVIWDAHGFTSGVYFTRLETDDRSENIKMVLLK